MPKHDGFIQTIRENPDDDALRLIYADWLDEHGNSARGEFIRIQCELERTPLAEDRWDILKAREDELLAAHRERWLAPLRGVIRRPKHAAWPEFTRGFVESIAIVPLVWLRFGAQLLRAEPIHQVTFKSTVGLANALARPELSELDALDFCPSFTSPAFDNSHLASLLDSSSTSRLRALNIGVDAEMLRTLFSSPLHLQLQELNLIHADDAIVKLLVEAPVSGKLRHLPMHNGSISVEGMNLLAAWPGLQHITNLAIGFNYGPSKTLALFQSPYLEAIEELHLSEMDLIDEELVTLVASPHVRRLRVLWIDSNDLTPKGIQALAASPISGQLTTLVLNGGDQEAEALAASPYLTNLRLLHFWGRRQVTERGAKALLASPYLGRKHRLLLGLGPLVGDINQRLRNRFKMRRSTREE